MAGGFAQPPPHLQVAFPNAGGELLAQPPPHLQVAIFPDAGGELLAQHPPTRRPYPG